MTSRGTFNLVIIFLGITLLACVGGALFLTNGGKDIPEFIVVIGGGALGAVGGILSKGPVSDEVQPVTVVDYDGSVGDIEAEMIE